MAAKSTQRLDHGRLAEFLAEKGLVEVEVIRDLLQSSNDGGTPFPEALVDADLITDWDLARAVCENLHLPFLPVEYLKPKTELLNELDPQFLVRHGLVPVQRFGNVLTVVMPGLVPAEALAELSALTDLTILPIVGTVEGNRRWLAEHCEVRSGGESDWGSLFDEGDANVQLALDTPESSDLLGLEEDLGDSLDALELAESADEVASIAEQLAESEELKTDAGAVELPPMPEFGQDS